VRFTLINNIKQDSAMRLILSALLIFISMYLISDIFVKYSSFGITGSAVKLTLFGSEAEYIDPISKASFLEFWHTEIFFIMMLLLTLSAVFVRLVKKSILVLNIVMISAIISIIALALSYFMSPLFISIYIATFFLWHASALYMTLYSLWRLYDKSV